MLTDHGVVTFWQLEDELVGTGQPSRLDHRFQRRPRVGQGDVLADATGEQHVVLQHHADLPAQRGDIG
ncbi:hypothetical protein D3C79_1105850 [compost metagenome]